MDLGGWIGTIGTREYQRATSFITFGWCMMMIWYMKYTIVMMELLWNIYGNKATRQLVNRCWMMLENSVGKQDVLGKTSSRQRGTNHPDLAIINWIQLAWALLRNNIPHWFRAFLLWPRNVNQLSTLRPMKSMNRRSHSILVIQRSTRGISWVVNRHQFLHHRSGHLGVSTGAHSVAPLMLAIC